MVNKNDIKALVTEELKRIQERHGYVYNTRYEKYAVLLERIQKIRLEFSNIIFHFDNAWDFIRAANDADADAMFNKMYVNVENIIQELIQTAACCRKSVRDCGIKEKPATCVWNKECSSGIEFETSCGNDIDLEKLGYDQREGIGFCPYCGKIIELDKGE